MKTSYLPVIATLLLFSSASFGKNDDPFYEAPMEQIRQGAGGRAAAAVAAPARAKSAGEAAVETNMRHLKAEPKISDPKLKLHEEWHRRYFLDENTLARTAQNPNCREEIKSFYTLEHKYPKNRFVQDLSNQYEDIKNESGALKKLIRDDDSFAPSPSNRNGNVKGH